MVVGRQVPLMQAQRPVGLYGPRRPPIEVQCDRKTAGRLPAVFHSLQRAILSGMISRSSAVGHGGGTEIEASGVVVDLEMIPAPFNSASIRQRTIENGLHFSTVGIRLDSWHRSRESRKRSVSSGGCGPWLRRCVSS